MDICTQCKKVKEEDGTCDCSEKWLDEEDAQAMLDAKAEGKDDEQSEGDEKKSDDDEPVVKDDEDSDDTDKGDSELEEESKPSADEEWKKIAAEQGWVPDHVRAKHANEAQALRDQVNNLQRIVSASQRNETEDEIDPNEGVTKGELDESIRALHDNALLSERIIRMQVDDYDEVVTDHLVPLTQKNPWIEEFLYSKPNPAKSAYEFAMALKEGKKVRAEFGEKGMELVIEGEKDSDTPKPKVQDPNRPDPKALEQANKQPKTIDSVPSASSTEATEISVEDFWNLPSDTLIRIRQQKPELYEKMQKQFHEKYDE
jgi:hypothetical protein